MTGSLHRVFYLNCAAGNPQSSHNASLSGTPVARRGEVWGCANLAVSLEYAEVVICSHLYPLTMGPAGCRSLPSEKSIG